MFLPPRNPTKALKHNREKLNSKLRAQVFERRIVNRTVWRSEDSANSEACRVRQTLLKPILSLQDTMRKLP